MVSPQPVVEIFGLPVLHALFQLARALEQDGFSSNR
jgi:hypothetical protein